MSAENLRHLGRCVVLGLSRRESWWKDAEILMLRHQLAVALRERPRPHSRPQGILALDFFSADLLNFAGLACRRVYQ